MYISTLLTLLCCVGAVSPSHSHPSHFRSSTFPTAAAVSGLESFTKQLRVPVYRNVTYGQAWVYPGNRFGRRHSGDECECFSPKGRYRVVRRWQRQRNAAKILSSAICCMGPRYNGPFCIAEGMGYQCCGSHYCTAKQTCCNEMCCDEVGALFIILLHADIL